MKALILLWHLCCLGGALAKRDGGEQRESAFGQCSGELGGCGDLDGDHGVGHDDKKKDDNAMEPLIHNN